MPFTFTMPKLSPTMEEGTIAKWHKKEGEYVEIDELLLEITTDKATVEHNALNAGYLRQIIVAEGESAATTQAIAVFTEEKEESIEGYQPEGMAVAKIEAPVLQEVTSEAKTPQQAAPATVALAKPKFIPSPPLAEYSFEFPRKNASERVLASPLARRLATEQGLDLTTLKGSGPNGRIMSRDLNLAQPAGLGLRRSLEVPSLPPGTYDEEILTPMRQVIAKRLQEAKAYIPHFYVRSEVDVASLVDIREQLKSGGMKITYNDFVIKACAIALRNHPEVNSGYHSGNDTIIRFKTVDISMAVTVKEGLYTPIIRHADFKGLGEISSESKALAKKAKEGKLEMHEYQGGSFTVSNMGMFDVTDFQAIINPPQAAILAIGAIKEQPVVKNQVIVPGKVMNIVLSVDHRVIDGVAAARFIQEVKHLLESPALLL